MDQYTRMFPYSAEEYHSDEEESSLGIDAREYAAIHIMAHLMPALAQIDDNEKLTKAIDRAADIAHYASLTLCNAEQP